MFSLLRISKKSLAWIIGLAALCLVVWLVPSDVVIAQEAVEAPTTINADELFAGKGGATEDISSEIGLGNTDIRITIARIIRVALGLLGIVALLLVLYGGFTFMTAGGNDEKIAEAKKILLNAGVGLIIIMTSYGIVSFVMSNLLEAINGGNQVTQDGGGEGEDDGGGSGSFAQAFYVITLPQVGEICIRNINPQIVFNKSVDIETVQGNIVVKEKEGGALAPGSWKYGSNQNTVIFTPSGSCTPSVGDDCLKASTDYILEFVDAKKIKSLNKTPEQTLNCSFRAGCKAVSFKSGEGVDRLPPSITIDYPTSATAIPAGDSVQVKVTYADDNGVQNVTLYHDGDAVDSVSFAGCKKTDTVTLDWTVDNDLLGEQTIETEAVDWAGLAGSDTQTVTVRPTHCYNGILEEDKGEEKLGPPECGGVCGDCAGAVCTAGTPTCSGGCVNGVCSDVMKIRNFSPVSGAPGTLVSINGSFFGTAVGKVYFANKERPVTTNAADWILAPLASCGTEGQAWSSSQILAEVPPGTANYSHIKVETAPSAGQVSVDATSNHPELKPYELNNLVRPKICAISPLIDKAGASVTLFGERFGEWTSAADKIMFGNLQADPVLGANNAPAWVSNRIVATVPSIEEGQVGVTVLKNGVESNSVRFTVQSGVQTDNPVISEITPNAGAVGEYITIIGNNFGDQLGKVWFKASPSSGAIDGDFSLPRECGSSFWSDTKVIVKFPKGTHVTDARYFVQINTAKDKTSQLDQAKIFTYKGGNPKPGICKITPTSGPVPFPAGQTVQLFGEYFLAGNNSQAQVYFWGTGAESSDTITNRPLVEGDGIVSIAANKIVVVPPLDSASGPVSVYRSNDSMISNPVSFSVFDCRSENAKCSATQHCCMNGDAAGLCKPNGELCMGEVLTAGYVWRFATKEIPPVPRVIERCDADVDAGKAIPSPSPRTKSNNAPPDEVCKNALVIVEFSTMLDQATVRAGNVIMQSCSSIENDVCANAKTVSVSATSYQLKTASAVATSLHQYLEMQPTEALTPGTWYRVVLNKNIKSSSAGGKAAIGLSIDKPCGGDSAYCFEFKAGEEECHLQKVIVTPFSYVTNILESPIKQHIDDDSFDVDYRGLGLADQECVIMNTQNLAWKWATSNGDYASIFGEGSSQVEHVNALGNTVGIGLEDDGIEVSAEATVNTTKVAGASPLVIDLSDPKIIDHWPKCLEACTNAEVGVRFNVSMSERNLLDAIANGSVQLFECKNENCSSKDQVGKPGSVKLTTESAGTVLKIANGTISLEELKPSTLYEVVISENTESLSSRKILWSRGKASDPQSFSKPLNSQFTWRFRTKAERCKIDRAEVLPKNFIARLVNDKNVYSVQPYSSPDACSATGQKLNPWSVSWDWTANDVGGSTAQKLVAKINTFETKGSNQFCTANCIKKGSTLPAAGVVVNMAVCGNGRIDAGEDCDGPNKDVGCSLDCRWLGKSKTSVCGNGTVESGESCDTKDDKTKAGCSAECLHIGSAQALGSSETGESICGFGTELGIGEDCDLSITGSVTNPKSSMNCSAKCLHTGTRLSSSWCFENKKAGKNLGGFEQASFEAACKRAFSQCGDGITDPDEDFGCDLSNGNHADWCTDTCLANGATNGHSECTVGQEGCAANGQRVGSSLMYATPSVCGDAVIGIGEDPFCDAAVNLSIVREHLIDPWVLATAIGYGPIQGTPPKQESLISAGTGQQTTQGTIRGEAKFTIACGYRSDNECAIATGNLSYGVGKNSCCYKRGTVLAKYPVNGSTNVCRNTQISAHLEVLVDGTTLPENVALLRGATTTCPPSSTPFTATGLPSSHPVWCAGLDSLAVEVEKDALVTSTSHVVFRLNEILAANTTYAVVIKKEAKDDKGVTIDLANVVWSFTTAPKVDGKDVICEVDTLTVNPSSKYFSKANEVASLQAEARIGGATGGKIQPVNGYKWVHIWKPISNPYVTLQTFTVGQNTSKNDITSRNANGEIDVRATAVVTENIFTKTTGTVAYGNSHIIVSLCENPWPPKDLVRNSIHYAVLPYEDRLNNNDAFSVSAKTFTGGAIPGTNLASGDGYFNFSTFYCADNGGAGQFDDLPYLQPAVQSTLNDLRVDVGTCEVSGDRCTTDASCGSYFTTGNQPFIAPGGTSRVCGGRKDAKDFVYLDSTGDPISCRDTVPDCFTKPDYVKWEEKGGYEGSCISLPVASARQLKCFKNPALKRFIFTNINNADAVGIQVFTNSQHLTAEEWYKRDKSLGGQGFVGNLQTTKVAGYDAVSDGSNVYVDALNWSGDKIYSNIYLFSINSGAKPETRQVFNQLLTNLKLNTNVPNNVSVNVNQGYCGPTIDKPDFETICTSDLDCKNGGVCSNQIEKLKRNYRRIRDLKTIDDELVAYALINGGKFPAITSGSYLSGQSLSVWDWSGLASALSKSLPKDPINKLGSVGTCKKVPATFCSSDAQCGTGDTCAFHNPQTGWSIEDRRFSFACATSSYAYRYKFSTTDGYQVLSRFENPQMAITNDRDFFQSFDFSNLSRISTNAAAGICDGETEIVTLNQGTCDDGQINLSLGEECDPSGSENFDRRDCKADGTGKMYVKKCATNCKWGAVEQKDCKDLNNCGNGRIDSGEVCDDGSALNGKWNKCNLKCTGLVAAGPEGPGYCGDTVPQTANEVCDVGRVDRSCVIKTRPKSIPGECPPVCSGQPFCKYNGTFTNDACSNSSDCIPVVFEYKLKPTISLKLGPSDIRITPRGGSENIFQDITVVPNTTSQNIDFCSEIKPPGSARCENQRDCQIRFTYRDGVSSLARMSNINFCWNGDASSCKTGECSTSIYAYWTSSPYTNPSMTSNDSVQVFLNKNAVPTTCEFKSTQCSPFPNCPDQIIQEPYEDCTERIIDAGKPTYGITKAKSCAWDCQRFGPHCGDGIVQKEYGEECDGTKTCSLTGTAGTQSCGAPGATDACRFKDVAAAGWWKLNKPPENGISVKNSGNTADGICRSSSSCPTFIENDGPRGATGTYSFDGREDYIEISHAASLMPTSTLTVEAWIKPTPSPVYESYQRILEKGISNRGVSSGGYELEFNPDRMINGDPTIKNRVAFALIDASGSIRPEYTVYTKKNIEYGKWTHIVATYEWKNGTEALKIYVDGNLDNSVYANKVAPFMSVNTMPIILGQSGGLYRNIYSGLLSNLKISNRTLQSDEVKDRFSNEWACVLPLRSTAVATAGGRCGDGVPQSAEFCDLGDGINGKPCEAGTVACRYCSFDCKSGDAQATQFCGNGIIEGAEMCEVVRSPDGKAEIVYEKYSNATTTRAALDEPDVHKGYQALTCSAERVYVSLNPGSSVTPNFKRGTKTCSNDCKRVVITETNESLCLECGLDKVNGVKVKGVVLNVLEANGPAYNNPIYTGAEGDAGIIDLVIPHSIAYDTQISTGNVYELNTRDTLTPEVFVPAKLNPNPTCSATSSPAGAQNHYALNVNRTKIVDPFIIVSDPGPWQYDVVLSPIIPTYVRQREGGAFEPVGGAPLRIVTTWVGANDFTTGLYKPHTTGRAAYLENSQDLIKKTGWAYFRGGKSDTGGFNIWHHGVSTTINGTSAEAITIASNEMTDDYMVYVAAHGQGMKNVKSGPSRLRVDVYMQVDAIAPYFTFSRPYKTFYINLADSSTSNINAPYWHVFTIKRDGPATNKIIPAASINSDTGDVTIYENGRIVTNRAQMN